MRKLIVALLIVGLASVAGAELICTWYPVANGVTTNNLNGAAANIGQVTIGNLVRTGLNTSSTVTGQFSSNGFNDGGDVSFSLTVGAGYRITSATLNSSGIAGSNTGPRSTQWQLNGVDAGAALVRTSSSTVAWDASIGTIGAGGNTLSIIMSAGSVNVTGGAVSSGGSYRINNLSLSGDIALIPEPMTMSLLGLSAMALILIRRKMIK